MNSQKKSSPRIKGAGFFRRLGAFVYDAFIVTAIALVIVMISLGLVALGQSLGWVNLPAGVEHADYLSEQLWFHALVWGSIIGFYLWFWVNSGQTIGMRTWRLKVQKPDGCKISYTQALIRLFTAAFGLGNLMVLVTKDNSAFQDIWSNSVVIYQAPSN